MMGRNADSEWPGTDLCVNNFPAYNVEGNFLQISQLIILKGFKIITLTGCQRSMSIASCGLSHTVACSIFHQLLISLYIS